MLREMLVRGLSTKKVKPSAWPFLSLPARTRCFSVVWRFTALVGQFLEKWEGFKTKNKVKN
jgi:hypothetical protein